MSSSCCRLRRSVTVFAVGCRFVGSGISIFPLRRRYLVHKNGGAAMLRCHSARSILLQNAQTFGNSCSKVEIALPNLVCEPSIPWAQDDGPANCASGD